MQTDSTDGVDQDLYGNGESPEPETKEQPDSVDEQNAEKATDLLSKSSFPGGCKVGDKYEVEITGNHGDQFSIKVVGKDSKDEADSDQDPDLAAINSKY